MNSYPQIRNLRRPTVLTLVFCLFTSLTGVPKTLAVPQDNSALLLQANTAITTAQTALVMAEAKASQSEGHLADLQASSSLTAPDINSLENMRRLTDTISRMINPETNKKLQEELDDVEKALVDAHAKLQAANTALANGTSPEIVAAKTRIQNNLSA